MLLLSWRASCNVMLFLLAFSFQCLLSVLPKALHLLFEAKGLSIRCARTDCPLSLKNGLLSLLEKFLYTVLDCLIEAIGHGPERVHNCLYISNRGNNHFFL